MRRISRRQRGQILVFVALTGIVIVIATSQGLDRLRILMLLGLIAILVVGLLLMRGGLARALPFHDILAHSLSGQEHSEKPISVTLALSMIGLFFLTGFSALLYQVAWQRLLGLFAGSDVRAITLVTGAYLGGLGVGGLVGAQISDRLDSRGAVRLYAVLNLGIALFAFLSRFIFYDGLFLGLGALSNSAAVILILVFASLLIPTTLMGLSLPLLSRALVRRIDSAAGLIATLNGVNIVGAAMGALIGGLVLVGSLGFDRSAYVGGALNAAVGLIGLNLSKQFATGDQNDTATPRGPEPLRRVPAIVWLWCGLVFISGFMSISLELIWFRVLDISLHSNGYTFAYLLFLFLLCDGFGNLVGARAVTRTRDPRRAFLALQGAIALYALGSVVLLLTLAGVDPLFGYFNRNINEGAFLTFAGSANDSLTWIVYIGMPALLMVIPATLIGFTFPFMQKAVQTDVNVVGQRVSILDVANIFGNATASFITGLLLFDWIGTGGSLKVIGVIGLVGLAAAAADALRSAASRRTIAITSAAALALLGLIWIMPTGAGFWSPLHQRAQDGQFYVAEDSGGVSVLVGDSKAVSSIVNGNPQGGIPFLYGHVLLGTMAALAHPAPTDILMIGLASGAEPGSAGLRPETRSVQVVEIVGSEVTVLRSYAETPNGQVARVLFNDPRYRIEVNDGRHLLIHTQQRYDVIQAASVQPFVSGSGFLYSEQFFQQARARLAPGGIMGQWRPTVRSQTTFMRVFPYGVILGGSMLLGSDIPLTFDRAVISARIESVQTREYLLARGIDPDKLKQSIQSLSIRVWTPTTPRTESDIDSDLWPRDEYFLNNAY